MPEAFACLLRSHRTRRRWSQEQLGFEADVSPRHLSCLETGKARPSRDMVLALARTLDLELRERNALLVSAGFAAVYPATALGDLPMAHVNQAIDLLLAKQEPYGALLVDRCWNVLRANGGGRRLLATEPGAQAMPGPLATNLVRATLHPLGLRPRVVNWHEIASTVLSRLERAHHAHPDDEERRTLLEEVRTYPDVAALAPAGPPHGGPAAVLRLRCGGDELQLFTLLTTLGTPLDVTAQELTIESFFPVDDATERWFRGR